MEPTHRKHDINCQSSLHLLILIPMIYQQPTPLTPRLILTLIKVNPKLALLLTENPKKGTRRNMTLAQCGYDQKPG